MIKHRTFNVDRFVDKFSDGQAYQELRSDRQPVVIISGADIADVLVKTGLGTPEALKGWLTAQFPKADEPTALPDA